MNSTNKILLNSHKVYSYEFIWKITCEKKLGKFTRGNGNGESNGPRRKHASLGCEITYNKESDQLKGTVYLNEIDGKRYRKMRTTLVWYSEQLHWGIVIK